MLFNVYIICIGLKARNVLFKTPPATIKISGQEEVSSSKDRDFVIILIFAIHD